MRDASRGLASRVNKCIIRFSGAVVTVRGSRAKCRAPVSRTLTEEVETRHARLVSSWWMRVERLGAAAEEAQSINRAEHAEKSAPHHRADPHATSPSPSTFASSSHRAWRRICGRMSSGGSPSVSSQLDQLEDYRTQDAHLSRQHLVPLAHRLCSFTQRQRRQERVLLFSGRCLGQRRDGRDWLMSVVGTHDRASI